MAKAKAAAKSKGGPKNVDWGKARIDYLADGSLSFADIAKKYGVSKTAVEAQSRKESWAQLRQDLGEKAYNEFQAKMLSTKDRAQSEHLMSFQNMRALINRAAMEMSQHNYYRDKKGNLILAKDKDGNDQPIPIPLDPFQLEKLAKAQQIAINGERVALGLPTSVSGLSDPDGGNVWKGFSDLVTQARKEEAEDALRRAPKSS